MQEKKTNLMENFWVKFLFSIFLGSVIGILIGVSGALMEIPPVCVGVFSGSASGLAAVIFMEKNDIFEVAGKKK